MEIIKHNFDMSEVCKIEMRRSFLFETLPEPLERSSEHLQFFDNYIENTNLRIRSIRSPKTKQWQYIFEKRTPIDPNDLSCWQVSAICLDENEHKLFEHLEDVEITRNGRTFTNELRFNRYFYTSGDKTFHLDVFLWPLWGLNIAKVFFDSKEEMQSFEKPSFAILEVTQNPFFIGKNLVGKTLEDVRREISRIAV